MIYFYDQYKSALGENYHVVGFPTQGDSGTYWTNYMFLVVNGSALGDAGRREQVAAFLEHILSYETQYEIRNPVRRDMLENRMKEIEIFRGSGADRWKEKATVFMFTDTDTFTSWWELSPGPKGDYRIEEYRQIMEKCAGISTDTSAIEDIIREEAGSYFSGDRDAEAVAELVQNRVQLYLNERW